MGDGSGKSSLRIDWFDGTLVENSRSNSGTEFADEDETEKSETPSKPQYSERKPIGFKRLLDISQLQPPVLSLEVANRPGFWMLLDADLKGDFIVLIVKVLASIYHSLEFDEKSKIANLLRTKLEKSMFLNTLKEYLINLPSVRIVEKRINMQMWDDAESFYLAVLSLLKGIINFHCSNVELLLKIYELLNATETSAIGVAEEHRERYSDELFIKLNDLKSRVKNITDENLIVEAEFANVSTEDPNSFRKLSIFPSKEDLLGNNTLPVEPNIIKGAYPNVEHYLDLQFRLLREDCFAPLRDGISHYIRSPSKRRFENIRVYPKVRIIRTYVSNNKVGHLVDIAWHERMNDGLITTKKYAYNKQLMFGSLLLFTNDNFETILCATVIDSSAQLLAEGYVAVSFENPVSEKIFSKAFVMVESEVFFEPYHRVLKVLQTYRDNLPMRRYIVDVQTETKPPIYLTSETSYSIKPSTKSEEKAFAVLDSESWPLTDMFGLDDSQMEAFKFALTREFAVIQGPPGTGKTFIGIKIAATLLKNLSLEGTPMLIVCYTNHALDQFLEGILDVTNNIVRLGSQSKSKVLESYTLHNLRSRTKSKYSHLYGSKRYEMEKIFKEMTDVQTEIEKCEKEIICYKTLKSDLKIDDRTYELKDSKEDPVLSWLFEHLNDKTESIDDDDDIDDWEKQLDSITDSETDKIETCFSVQWALKEIDSMNNSIKYIKDINDDHLEGQKMTDKFETQIEKVRKRLDCFKKYNALSQTDNVLPNIEKVKDLYKLSTEQRWNLYYKSIGSIKKKLIEAMNNLLAQHNTCSRELDEVSTLIDSEVLKTARVVGVTTTAAARRHQLMRKLLSPIVIVEEAAEVLEAHIVASLTHHCQHLILIGDHKQLRPTAAHYKLAKEYNLEISLFERMIRNGVHARTLTTQRRMRPNVADLLVPIIYERLDNHPCVYNYPDVRGMRNNLYFVTHDAVEDFEGLEDSWSHKNTLEAKWCVVLANYLRKMNYTAEEITILATYTGQVSLIKELARQHTLLQDVKITAVDNFQGEENKIVILSLVRSNRDCKIGFLAAANRICVALSRAKEGFYIFGNMDVLKSASNIWRFINDKLVAEKCINNHLTLQCHRHEENTMQIHNPDSFEKALALPCFGICSREK